MKYFLISDNRDTLVGMRLAGVDGALVDDRASAQTAIAACIEDASIGVILVTEKLAALCPDLIYELKLKSTKTLVIEIPDRHGTGRAPDSITRYIREAIGVKL